jgi:hypothetical protein
MLPNLFYRPQTVALLATPFLLSLFPLPADSTAFFTLQATAQPQLGIFGGEYWSLISAPGQIGGSITSTPDQPNNQPGTFVAQVSFGDLHNGDGSPTIASASLRVRGNSACHTSISVTSYSVGNLTNRGNLLIGQANELSFVTLGSGSVVAGPDGNLASHAYGPKFVSGTDTLNTLNNGVIGPVSTNSDRIATYSTAPSNRGNLTSTTNYVQDTVTFSIPTGFVWGPANSAASGNFNISLQMDIYPGV